MLLLGRKIGESLLFDNKKTGTFGGLLLKHTHDDWVMCQLWRDHRQFTAPFSDHGEFEKLALGVFQVRPRFLEFIDEHLEISLNELRSGKVVFGIDAPKEMLVVRTEVLREPEMVAKVPDMKGWVDG